MNDKPKWGISEYARMAAAIVGGVCIVAAILMTSQGKVMQIANAPIPAGLIFLVAGLIFAHLALGRLIRAIWVGLIVSMSILGTGLFLGYYLWGGAIIEIPAITKKYDIFRDLLSIFLAILAGIGLLVFLVLRGAIEKTVERRIEEATQRIERDRSLFMAHLQRAAGYMFWQLFTVEQARGKSKASEENHTNPGSSNRSTETTAKTLLSMAIERAQHSLEYTKDLPETESEYKKTIYACKANLVYFLAEATRIEGFGLTKQHKTQALELARETLAVASKEEFPEEYYELQESCAYALWRLTEAGDAVSKQEARNIMRRLLSDSDIPFDWRKRIKNKWATLGAI